MNTKTMALAVLLLASAGTAALAQERGRGGERVERLQSGEARGWQGQGAGRAERPQAPQRQDNGGGWRDRQTQTQSQPPAVAPQAPVARVAPQAPSAGQDWRQGRNGSGGAQSWPRGRGGVVEGAGGGLTGQDRQDAEDWNDLNQARAWGGGRNGGQAFQGGRTDPRADPPRQDRQGRDDRRQDGDRDRVDRRNDRPTNGRGYVPERRDDRSGWNRNDRNGRGDNHGQPRWDRRNYPSVYRSLQRYRGPIYRTPPGFYLRVWSFGEVLPRGWYGDEYRLIDWWNYGLPMPPAGYSWVRVGSDVLLIDEFTGRIEQVVRDVFW